MFGSFGGANEIYTGDIGHSLRFRSAASARLNRTFSTPTSANVWAFSFWFKRGAISVQDFLWTSGTEFYIAADDTIRLYASGADRITTSAKYRDPLSPLHGVLSSNGTTITLYVNGSSVGSYTGTCGFNSASLHYIGGGSAYFDGYLSRIAFVDGQALTPSSFGYLNTEINEWVSKSQSAVKAVVDAGDSNSFMLDFDDATSLTTLGNDKSSKGNNWTLNGFSLTAGTTYDHMLDVPGNSFATLNPLAVTTYPGTLTEGNLKTSGPAVGGGNSYSSIAIPATGLFYFEVLLNSTTASSIGISAYNPAEVYAYQNANSAHYYTNGQKYVDGSASAFGASYTNNDLIGVAVDAAGSIEFFKNGVSQGTISHATAGLFPVFADGSSGAGSTAFFNFGQAPLHASATYHSAAGGYFRYTPPTGFKALCQRNLPTPAILNPEKHFDVKTHSGTGAIQSVTGVQFSPELLWVKNRSGVQNHYLQDSVRGVTNYLVSNNTGAENQYSGTGSSVFTAFNSDGFSMAAADPIGMGNSSGQTYVDWLWKMGGAAVTNNNGSISSQVSANVLAGQSVVTYTGTGANATVGHGLSSAPELVIVKNLGSAIGWRVYHKDVPTAASSVLVLQTTAAYVGDAAAWNSTAPTSAVFSLGTSSNTNESAKSFVAYCFHSVPGYSKVGSYTGNGSTDGPYVECGFKPKYVLVKRIDVAGYGWPIYDSVRSFDNPCNEDLYANSASAESTFAALDFTSTGFKLRSTDAYTNASGGTYIFIAIADVAGKYALGR